MKMSSAKRPTVDGSAYHVALSPGQMPRFVLLPGDPERVERILSFLSEPEVLSRHREYVSGKGFFDGVEVGVCSTGIGAPSTAIAVEELASLGCDTFVRVGSTGALQEHINLGDLIINSASVRLEGTSAQYVVPGYPAHAHYSVVMALAEACGELGAPCHVGVGASTDSFYVGQGRPGFGDYLPSFSSYEDLRAMNVLNYEMEASALFTLCSIYGLRAGSVCATFANRPLDTFGTVGEDNAIRAALRACTLLSRWDERRQKAGLDHIVPSLSCGDR